MGPVQIWKLSTILYRRRLVPLAWLMKTVNYLVFRAVLPYEVELGDGIVLWHRGLGTVVHPNIRIGDDVKIAHGVTIAGTPDGRSSIGNGVTIAANATIIPERMRPYSIGHDTIVGAGAVVVGDLPANSIARGPKATVVPRPLT